MLVLSRKESQRIRLGDSIVVTIVKISGDKVRVGIEAPADVLVLRDELEVRSDAAKTAPASPLATPPAASTETLSALQLRLAEGRSPCGRRRPTWDGDAAGAMEPAWRRARPKFRVLGVESPSQKSNRRVNPHSSRLDTLTLHKRNTAAVFRKTAAVR